MTNLATDASWPHSGVGNGTLSDFVFNRSQVPGSTVTDALNALLAQIFGPLTLPRAVYVNATTGSDTNTGTSPSQPWQTMQRAWDDIQTYSKLNATYTMQLQGAGPFTMPVMVDSLAGQSGFLCILGDPAAEETLVAGTFDGDIAGYTVPTLAGLGEIDEWGGECIKILTGDLAGARVMLATNTDTSLTVTTHAAWDALGVTAAGDTFEVRRPGTEIVIPSPDASTGASAGPENWRGGNTTLFPRHILSNVKLTGSAMLISNSTLALVGVRSEAGLQTSYSQIMSGLQFGQDLVGASDAFGWGLQAVGGWFSAASQLSWLSVMIGNSGFFGGSTGIGDEVILAGARFDGDVQMVGVGKIEAYGSGYVQSTRELFFDTNSVFTFFVFDQILNCAVTSGDCLRANAGAAMLIDTTTLPFGGAVTGGTSDAEGGGLGCNAIGGGRINWVNQTPTLTGGVLNQDLDAGNGPVANATLAANGDGESDISTLSVIARVPAAA